MSWDYFNRFESVVDKYMPDMGEGDTKASQIVTAVNKLVYKWYNDGDVFDNVNSPMQGWANDLSSYANWLNKYADGCDEILDGIADCYSDDDYEALLVDLADKTLNVEYLADYTTIPCEGTIYDCEGPFEFAESYEDEEDEW